MVRILGLLLLVLVGVVVFAGELGGEVVTLRTQDTIGRYVETKLWIVDDGGVQWLRAGNPSATWYQQLKKAPQVELERGPTLARYTAVPVEGARARINALMAERYGWADQLIGVFANREDSVPIRLDPRP
jgi:hypothetical protein